MEWNNQENMREEMKKCSILIVSQSNTQDTMGRLPAKFFEYLGIGIPIIGIGRKNSDLSKIISKLQCGVFFEFDTLNNLNNCFLNYHNKYLKKEQLIKNDEIHFFSWKNQANNLMNLLKEIS